MSKGRRKEKKAQRRSAGAGHRPKTSRARDSARFCRRYSRVLATLEGKRAGLETDERRRRGERGSAGGRRVSGGSPAARTDTKTATAGLLPEKCGSAEKAEAASSSDVAQEFSRGNRDLERAALRCLCRVTAEHRPQRVPGRQGAAGVRRTARNDLRKESEEG